MTGQSETNKPKGESGFYEPYAEFARALRTWFIAYGIGVPAVLLTNESCRQAIAVSGKAKLIGAVFLGGVAIQVIVALLYKAAMWELYSGELDPIRTQSKLYKWADRFSDSFLFEFVMDVMTFVLFVIASVQLLSLLTGG